MSMKKFYVGVKGIVQDPVRGLLLLHRDYKSGDYWDIPGGRMDGDEDFADTLKRELGEELPGIEVKEVRELLGAFRLPKDIEEGTSLVLLYFRVEATLPDPIILSEEHESYAWVNGLDELPEGLNPGIEKILRQLLDN